MTEVSRKQELLGRRLGAEGQLVLGDMMHQGSAKQGAWEVTQREAVGGCHMGHFTLAVSWEWMEWAICLDLASSSSWLGVASELQQIWRLGTQGWCCCAGQVRWLSESLP